MSATRENRPPPRFRTQVTDRLLPGLRRSFAVPSPAAGQDWSLTVPGGRVWRLLAIRATLQTSVVGGNRNVGLSLSDGNNELFTLLGTANIPALTANAYRIIQGGQISFPVNATTSFMLQIPPWLLPSGWTISPATTGLLGGDQWSAITAHIEEIYESWPDVETHRELEVADALDQLTHPMSTPGG